MKKSIILFLLLAPLLVCSQKYYFSSCLHTKGNQMDSSNTEIILDISNTPYLTLHEGSLTTKFMITSKPEHCGSLFTDDLFICFEAEHIKLKKKFGFKIKKLWYYKLSDLL